ncbi:hypothetical protein C5C31_03440 [Rathayibacter rathayi]|nr:hypothetical protein C5C34_04180 [Rathayibacter rathayi]PPG70822.1 hypothetical protein C5C02_03480 [Rathayibacter rathayi]PPG77934.1 hypothetical protein C5C23_04530 [Rathayibacter rathayi]PPG95586.1 hypothetical protein C5C22_05800 [Rathayibacter rathayi]PPH25644.1 hypothetical protein C5C31_03440 [Rathayibacter rathayi]
MQMRLLALGEPQTASLRDSVVEGLVQDGRQGHRFTGEQAAGYFVHGDSWFLSGNNMQFSTRYINYSPL